MVLRVYLDGANIGRSRTFEADGPPDIDPKQLWIACESCCGYFSQKNDHEPAASFRCWEWEGSTAGSRSPRQKREDPREMSIRVCLRMVFNENTFRWLGRNNAENKYWTRLLDADEGRIFLKAPNREDDDEWLLARAMEDYRQGDTVIIVSNDNYDKWRDDYATIVPRCLMKYQYDNAEHRFTLKKQLVEQRLSREFDRQRERDEAREKEISGGKNRVILLTAKEAAERNGRGGRGKRDPSCSSRSTDKTSSSESSTCERSKTSGSQRRHRHGSRPSSRTQKGLNISRKLSPPRFNKQQNRHTCTTSSSRSSPFRKYRSAPPARSQSSEEEEDRRESNTDRRTPSHDKHSSNSNGRPRSVSPITPPPARFQPEDSSPDVDELAERVSRIDIRGAASLHRGRCQHSGGSDDARSCKLDKRDVDHRRKVDHRREDVDRRNGAVDAARARLFAVSDQGNSTTSSRRGAGKSQSRTRTKKPDPHYSSFPF
ncbi:unnamed protein product [Amoebophrya sp. A25]|nr:unnamed protein product [Amoebophrya sp. A25]|eukprot:GSA25T00010780001.1